MRTDRITNLLRFAALLAAMTISFTVQRDLALSHGVPEYVAPAVPLAIDIGMLWAVRVGRDVALAVAVSVLANVAQTLTSSPLDQVATWVPAALHSVFPLILWRMERAPRGHADKMADNTPVAVSAPASIADSEPPAMTAPVATPPVMPLATPEPVAKPGATDTLTPDDAGQPVAKVTEPVTVDADTTSDADTDAEPVVKTPRPRGRTLADVKAVIAALQDAGTPVTGDTYAAHVGTISSRTARRDLARVGFTA